MRVNIHNVPTDIRLQTVKLAPTDDDNSYLFRCYRCGTAIARIKGKVVEIEAGYVPNNNVPVINQCPNCHENYTFLTVTDHPGQIILTLAPQETTSIFRCVVCRTPLLQFTGQDIIFTLPLMKHILTPYLFDCSCDQHYLLHEIVSLGYN